MKKSTINLYNINLGCKPPPPKKKKTHQGSIAFCSMEIFIPKL